jgi:hypothetical protein
MGGVGWRSLLCVGLSVATFALGGCGDTESARETGASSEDVKPSREDDEAVPAAALRERPWEVVSRHDETYLANVFYADAIENEQIMPFTNEGRPQIDRLVYPTLGNPNLYVKSDAEDELVIVLRLEDSAYAHLRPSVSPEVGSSRGVVTLAEDDQQSIDFFLVARAERASAESASGQVAKPGVVAIKPTKILQNAEPAEMPAALKSRHTLRFVFDKAAMANVPAGLYDTRFEVKKGGQLFANVYEYQYNSVRVFDAVDDAYTALNVTDTQVSVGGEYTSLTADKLDDLVDGVNASTDPQAKNAAFITFNGDLHNGGSPGTLRQRAVAMTYADEAKRVVGALKRLNLPIFLTAGNHDGYAAIGHAPDLVKSFDARLGDTLEKVIDDQNNRPWPDYSWSDYDAFLSRTSGTPGGLHKDIFQGAFRRSVGQTFSASFADVPRGDRNMILYDGFYQWQKTYGPLYASWTFGKNRWVSMNSYELRQHRRTGWGMYTVNYGGSVSKTQLEWLDRELARGKNADEDIVVLMHHDPRGGHHGLDFGYYSPTLEYRDIAQSTINYLLTDRLLPLVCKQPEWSLSIEQRESCLHDGLQEWMAPDPELDAEGNAFFLSGVELLKRLVKNPNARTLVLGHVHFNSLEVLRSGDEIVPNRLALDPVTTTKSAMIEVANPVRRMAWEDTLAPARAAPWRNVNLVQHLADANTAERVTVETSLDAHSFDAWRTQLDGMLANASRPGRMTTMSRDVQSEPRELAILRFTSAADLTSQKYGTESVFGWSILHVTKQTSSPRINRLTYFMNAGADAFKRFETIDVDRTKSVKSRGAGNPVDDLFDW